MSTVPSEPKNVSRRRFLSLVGGASSLAVATKIAVSNAEPFKAHAAPPPADPAHPGQAPVLTAEATGTDTEALKLAPADATVRRVLDGVGPGTNVYGWKVVDIHAVQFGAIPVVMEDPKGDRFQVDVCLRDTTSGAPKAVANAGVLSFFLSNQGAGGTKTDESKGLGAVALAAALTKASGQKGPQFQAPGMTTLRQRYTAFPNASYSVPV